MKLLVIGTKPRYGDAENRSISISNVAYISLPIVYVIFMLLDIDVYINSQGSLKWDQLIVPLFIIFCLFFLYLNFKNLVLLSRLLFLVSWPLALHIVPIIYQETPPDYYLAYPIGLIFHAVLIQTFIGRKKYSILFFILLVANFSLMMFFSDFLSFFDRDIVELSIPFSDYRYYKLDGILYWLLFNLMTFFLLESLDYRDFQMRKRQVIIRNQSIKLSESLRQLQKAQKQLITSEKMASLGVLSAGIAHEVNNPLNFIKGGVYNLSDLLKNEKKENKVLDQLIGSIEEGANRIQHIVKSLSQFSNENDEFTDDCNIHEIIDNCLVILQPSLEVSIVRQFQDKMPIIKGNEGSLHQTFLNILRNAEQAIEGNGKITITTQSSASTIETLIHDSGKGISTRNLNKVGDPFFTTKSPGDGIGLGLYTAFNVIKEHQGEISFDSELGRGTKCKIKLPLNQ